MNLMTATILMFGATFSLCAQVNTNRVPHTDERTIRLENAPLFICLDIYTEMTGMIVKNATTSHVDGVTFRTESAIPKDQLAKQLEACLKEKGVALVPTGTNTLKAVSISPTAQVQQHALPTPRSHSAPMGGVR